MKKHNLNEQINIRRWKKLAGIINENTSPTYEEDDTEVNEAEEEETEETEETEEGGGGLIDISAGPDAVLKAAADIPQNILAAGETDDKGAGDEKIKITKKTAVAKDMIPTQKEIGSGQSLDDQIKDKFGNLDRALKGGMLASKSGKFPILTYGGKYILDGHHRWSQFLASNPEAVVQIADISAPGVKNSKEALALAHVILFALYGKSPTKDFEGENLIGKNADWVEKYVAKKVVNSAIKKLFAAKPDIFKGSGVKSKRDLDTDKAKQAVGKYYANNLFGEPGQNLKKGKFSRTSMPQGADAGDPTGLTQTPEKAAAGAVNYLNPTKADVKENLKRYYKEFFAEAEMKKNVNEIFGWGQKCKALEKRPEVGDRVTISKKGSKSMYSDGTNKQEKAIRHYKDQTRHKVVFVGKGAELEGWDGMWGYDELCEDPN